MMTDKYRLDIQVLRGISIFVVFLYHLYPDNFPNGYLGVDMFFVISGFLISLHLFKEYDQSGNINLIRFYANRILRLFPALFVLLFLVSISFYFFSTPYEYLTQLEDSQFLTFWASNFLFSSESLQYFDSGESDRVFLHTWSLSVEEQFYLVWPLFILIIGGLWKNHPARRLCFFIFLFIALMSLSYFARLWFPEKYFFMTIYRASELGLGTMLSAAFLLKRPAVIKPHLEIFVSIVLGLVLCSVFLASYQTKNDVLTLCLILICVSWVIYFGIRFESKNHLANCAVKLVKYFGDISYSLYLWHWPIIVGANRINSFIEIPFKNLWIVSLSLIISVVSYHFIEQPFRKNPSVRTNLKNVILSGVVVSIFAFMILFVVKNSYSNRYEEHLIQWNEIKFSKSMSETDGCDSWLYSAEVKPCIYGPETSEKTLVIFGDSSMAQWLPIFRKWSESNDVLLFVLLKSSCPLTHRPFYWYVINAEFTICYEWRQSAIDWIRDISPDLLILGGASYSVFSDEEFDGGTRETLTLLGDQYGQLRFLAEYPGIWIDGLKCAHRREIIGNHFGKSDRILNACFRYKHLSNEFEILKEIEIDFPKMKVIDYSDLVCDGEKCSPTKNDLVVYKDGYHLTLPFLNSISHEFFKRIELEKLLTETKLE